MRNGKKGDGRGKNEELCVGSLLEDRGFVRLPVWYL